MNQQKINLKIQTGADEFKRLALWIILWIAVIAIMLTCLAIGGMLWNS